MERKKQIIESKFPPSNKEVIWLDSNTDELKKNRNGKWVSITSMDSSDSDPDSGDDDKKDVINLGDLYKEYNEYMATFAAGRHSDDPYVYASGNPDTALGRFWKCLEGGPREVIDVEISPEIIDIIIANTGFDITSDDGSDYFEGRDIYDVDIEEFSIRKPHAISLVPQPSNTETEWGSPIVHYTGMFLADNGKLSTLNIAVGYDEADDIKNKYPYEGAGNPNDYGGWIRPEHITPTISIKSYE